MWGKSAGEEWQVGEECRWSHLYRNLHIWRTKIIQRFLCNGPSPCVCMSMCCMPKAMGHRFVLCCVSVLAPFPSSISTISL